jgi:hypothetical protein
MPKNKAEAVAVAEPETDDDLETLEEVEGEEPTEAKPKKKRSRKAKEEKPQVEGKTSKEVANELGITPVKLRRILRTDDFFNDSGYTRYFLSDEDIERLKAAIAAGAERKAAAPRKTKKGKGQEVAAAEVANDLEDLEDLGDEDEAEEVDLDDEDEEDDE